MAERLALYLCSLQKISVNLCYKRKKYSAVIMICRLTLNGTTSQQYIELSVKYNDFGTHWEAVHSRGNVLWNKGEGRSALY